MSSNKLLDSLNDLKAALEYYTNIKNNNRQKRLAFLSLSKAFEVSVEYSWKNIKRKVMEEGLDPQSPKASIRDAAKIDILENVELWLGFIDARNSSVHDYFSITEAEYVIFTKKFIDEAEKVINKL